MDIRKSGTCGGCVGSALGWSNDARPLNDRPYKSSGAKAMADKKPPQKPPQGVS